jgi:hypothetical protein
MLTDTEMPEQGRGNGDPVSTTERAHLGHPQHSARTTRRKRLVAGQLLNPAHVVAKVTCSLQ